MPQYAYSCPKCEVIKEVLHANNEKPVYTCEMPGCGTALERYWMATTNATTHQTSPHVSESLAIHPDQTAEHKKHFPDVGVLSDGRIVCDTPKIRDRYLNARGFVKTPQRIR